MIKPMAKMTPFEREAHRAKLGVYCAIEDCKKGAYSINPLYCRQHLYSHKKFKDPLRRNRFTPNEIEVIGDSAYIQLYDIDERPIAKAIVDANKVKNVKPHKWCRTKTGYVQTTIGKPVFLHRFLLETEANTIDHIDGDKLNNRLNNLRPATWQQNMINKSSKSTSGFKGVYSSGSSLNPWIVRVWVGNDNVNVGLFSDINEAAHVYNDVATQLLTDSHNYVRLNAI